VAGRAFATLRRAAASIRHVVPIGPAHFVPFRGLAVSSAAAFRTPLGDVPLDRDAIEAIGELPQECMARELSAGIWRRPACFSSARRATVPGGGGRFQA